MKKISIFLLLGLSLGSCQTKIEDSQDIIDKKPEIFDGFLFYPNQGQIYLSNIEDLIGEYVVIIKKDSVAYTEVLGRAITTEGINAIKKSDLSQQAPCYSSRVSGGFAANLSFAAGNVNLNNSYVYDVVLKKNNSATIPKEFRYIDENQYNTILNHLPDEYLALYFITGIEYRTLSTKEFKDAVGDAKIGLTAVKVGGKVYYSNEQINSMPIIYYTGINESNTFGNFDSNKKAYNKTPKISYAKQLHLSIVPESLKLDKDKKNQNMELIKKAIPKK
jgi:hypothetical protein